VAIDAWTTVGVLTDGRGFRPVNRADQVGGAVLSEKVIWQLIKPYAEATGVPESRLTISAAHAPSCAGPAAASLNRFRCFSATRRYRQRNGISAQGRTWFTRRTMRSTEGRGLRAVEARYFNWREISRAMLSGTSQKPSRPLQSIDFASELADFVPTLFIEALRAVASALAGSRAKC